MGPVWHGGKQGEPELLESCYRNSLQLAVDNGVRTIAFPAISTGVYGYPTRQAAAIAVRAMRGFEDKVDRIIACCFSQTDAEIYRQELSR